MLYLRQDKYNKNISKYYVEVDEDDASVDEDLERITRSSSKACIMPKLFNLGFIP